MLPKVKPNQSIQKKRINPSNFKKKNPRQLSKEKKIKYRYIEEDIW